MKRKISLHSLRPSSIRTQIVLGFGLILGLTLIIVLINYYTLQTLQAGIASTFDEAGRVRELGLEIQNAFSIARQQERLFLDSWREIGIDNAKNRYVRPNQLHIGRARVGLEELDRVIEESSSQQFAYVLQDVMELRPLLDEYETAFTATVEQIEDRSYAGGQERRLQHSLNELEAGVSSLPNVELDRLLLQMSANEQAFFSTGEQQYADKTRLLVIQFKDLVNTTPQTDWAYARIVRPRLLDLADNHLAAFKELALLEAEIAINIGIFQEVTADIIRLTNTISANGAEGLAQARSQLRRTAVRHTSVTVLVGVAALLAGALTAVLLARRILGPLSSLTEAAQQIGRGNLDHSIAVSGRDEFATLAAVFNQMATQLQDLIGSLEQLVADRTRALATSFQVSSHLSTILDQKRLVTEVVEQVRSAFDYYHVHIYELDAERQHLVMVGGTGEAGLAMLAGEHKLERGQGLVGKAAETGRVVLVPDVSADPSWLPNPLLPGTKAEIAVPIALGGQVLGVLDVQHDMPGGLNQSDAQLLQSIANQVAIAMQNAQLYDEARRMAERQALVNAISLKIQKAVTVEGVLQIASRELGQALGAQRASIQLGPVAQDRNGRE